MYAGPAIMLSFVLAGLGCAFAGLCYAEFASMIPLAGSRLHLRLRHAGRAFRLDHRLGPHPGIRHGRRHRVPPVGAVTSWNASCCTSGSTCPPRSGQPRTHVGKYALPARRGRTGSRTLIETILRQRPRRSGMPCRTDGGVQPGGFPAHHRLVTVILRALASRDQPFNRSSASRSVARHRLHRRRRLIGHAAIVLGSSERELRFHPATRLVTTVPMACRA